MPAFRQKGFRRRGQGSLSQKRCGANKQGRNNVCVRRVVISKQLAIVHVCRHEEKNEIAEGNGYGRAVWEEGREGYGRKHGGVILAFKVRLTQARERHANFLGLAVKRLRIQILFLWYMSCRVPAFVNNVIKNKRR